MTDEIKEILSKDNIHIIECEENWCNAYGYEKSQLKEDLLDYITNLQEDYEKEHYLVDKLTGQLNDEYKNTEYQCNQKEVYKSRNENAQDLILNELSHLKANDEETWNKEFYDENNKLDYRKLCIELLNQVINLLDGGDEEC